jgi:tight adherence protein C
MLLFCVALGISVLLFFLPACLGTPGNRVSALQGRIEVERQERLDRSFQTKSSRFSIAARLDGNDQVLPLLCRWTGTDSRKTEEILNRLQLNVTLPEVVIARAAGGLLLVGSVAFLSTKLYSGGEAGTITWVFFILSLIAYLFPSLLLDWAEKRAKSEIREQVPIFFSIVQALVEAGMPIQAAVKNTARRFDGRLGWELARLEVEEKRWGNWRKALEEMAYRWEVDALISIALEINEAVSKGVSIAGMLSVQVEEQLRQQEDEASEYMNRLNIRLLPFVILLMGVPLLFLVMGPAFLSMKAQL